MSASTKPHEERPLDKPSRSSPRRSARSPLREESRPGGAHPISPRRAIPDDVTPNTSHRTPQSDSRNAAWSFWLDPRFVVIAFSGVLALCTFLYPANRFENWSTTKYFNTHEFILTLAAIAALCLGMTLSTLLTPHQRADQIESDTRPNLTEDWYHGLGYIVILGYVAWVAIASARGATLPLFAAVLHRDLGAISLLKERLAPVSGVTTLTQLSSIVSALGAYRFVRTRTIGKLWCFVLFAGLFRTLFYAERLALMEVLLPAALVLVLMSTFTKRHHFIMNLIPVIGIAFLVVVFSASEYFRSWIYYSQTGEKSFIPWVLERLLGYYATSFNNNSLFYSQLSGSPHPIYFTIPFVFDFPGASIIFGAPSFGGSLPKDWWMSLLSWSSTPEFNNPGSYLIPLADLGTVTGLVFWTVIGIPIGYVYRRARQHSDIALITYSVIFLGLLELPRFVYWTLGRYFPAAIALIFFMGHAATRDRRMRHVTSQNETALRNSAS